MKKLGVLLGVLTLAAGIQAQDNTEDKQSFCSVLAQKNILNHMDVGVNVGTLGLGIDIAVPVGDYVRIRAGYNYMPGFRFHSDFNIGGKTSVFLDKFGKINEKLVENNIDVNWDYFKEEKELMDLYESGGLKNKDYLTLEMKPNIHQFKFLVDVMPFKNNKHWSFTAGFFVGPSSVAEAYNIEEETAILKAVNLYNNRYYKDYILSDMYFKYIDGDGITHNAEISSMTNFVMKNGIAAYNLGTFPDGDKALMVPKEDNTVNAEMKVNKFRPYLGFGYNTHLSKNKKWNLNVDAGILFLCGAPSVYVDNVYKVDASPLRLDEDWNYLGGMGIQRDESGNAYYFGDIVRFNVDKFGYEYCDNLKNHVDLVHDLKDIPGKVGDMVSTISKFKVYPNASVTVSYKLF